jgi:hypothetical protein
MTHEITQTSRSFADKDIPDGEHLFEIQSVEKKYGKNGGEFFVWKLTYEGDGVGEQVLLPNMMAGLLRVLDCKEVEPNKFDWDTDEQSGKRFFGTVSHGPDYKNPEIIRQHMGEFKAVEEDAKIPF